MEPLKDIVYQKLCDRIFSGESAPGSRLPGELELSRAFGVSRVTLRAALAKLEAEGLIARSRQNGTVVQNPLAAERSRILVVVKFRGEELTDTPELQMISGISSRCLELGMEMETLDYDYLSGGARLDDRYFGVIQSGCRFHGGEKFLEVLRESALPVVNAMAFGGDPAVTGEATVLVDAFPAYLAGIEHLRLFGHRRIAFLMNEWETSGSRFMMTFAEFAERLEAAGVEHPERYILFPGSDGHFTDGVKTLLRHSGPPSAFYCYKDSYALDVYRAARETGLEIPAEVAVMGFSGGTGAPLMRPPLSTVDFGYARIGRIAVDMLMRHKRWEHCNPKPIIQAPYSVIVRKSTDYFRANDPCSSSQ